MICELVATNSREARHPMAAPWQVVRVFISSTFRDMEAERDLLARFVLPRLREELLPRRIRLVDIDLRWGVTSDQDALGACREIIDECRPRFVCMLGERYGHTPAGQPRSITEEEVLYGALEQRDRSQYALCYFRDPRATSLMVEEHPGDFREPAGSESARRLANLKSAIDDAGLLRHIYSAHWDSAQHRLVGLEQFGDRVYRDLLATINDEFGPQLAAPLGEFADETAAMDTVVQEDADRYFLGSRAAVLADLTAFAAGRERPAFLLLTGDSGVGKSALLAEFCRSFPAEGGAERTLVIPHFVGNTAGSTDLRQMLRRLFYVLHAALGISNAPPDDIMELVEQFPLLLRKTALAYRLVLVIDAINQLSAVDNAHTMHWLPAELPSNIRIILSEGGGGGKEDYDAATLEWFAALRAGAPADETENRRTKLHRAVEAIRARGDTVRVITLEPLTHDDARTIIHSVMHRYRKQMDEIQVNSLLAKPDIGSPLYLVTAMEELRTLGTHDGLSARIGELPGDIGKLLVWILEERLSNDPGLRDAGNRPTAGMLVRRFVTLLAVGRHGLSMAELTALIDPGDPLGNVAALRRFLNPFLMSSGALLAISHTRFREVVNDRYLASEAPRLEAHRAVATLFRSLANPEGKGRWTGPPRALSELPHHLTQGHLWNDGVDVLMDYAFRDRSMVAMGPHRYVEQFKEFTAAAARHPEASPALQRLAMTLPIDEHTTLLLGRIAVSLEHDPSAAARLMIICAEQVPDNDRSVIPLQALCRAFRRDASSVPVDVRSALIASAPRYFGSKNKRVRWESAYNFGFLVAETTIGLLLALAESPKEHPLVRAEAARQLGRATDNELPARLLRLAAEKPYPLHRMAARSARQVQARLGLLDPEGVDDWSQATSLPDDLAALLKELGAAIARKDLAAVSADTRFVIHIIGSNTLSMEERWQEVRILETVIRRMPCRLVCAEGGTGDDSLTPLRTLASLEAWEQTATRFFQDFGLSAEEYLQLTSRYDYLIWGVEDAARMEQIYEAKRRGLDVRSAVEHVDRAKAICRNSLARLDASGSQVAVLTTQWLPGRQVARLMPAEGRARGFMYVPIELNKPRGELFEMDVNYIHSAL